MLSRSSFSYKKVVKISTHYHTKSIYIFQYRLMLSLSDLLHIIRVGRMGHMNGHLQPGGVPSFEKAFKLM